MRRPFDKAYSDRVMSGVLKALYEAGYDPKTTILMFHADEAVDVLVTVIAGLIESGPDAKTPRGRRLLGEELGRRIANRVFLLQEAGGFAGALGDVPVVLRKDEDFQS
jgi:hypothetical protein